MNEKHVAKILVPGTKVGEFTVYPVGIKHVKKFTAALTRAIAMVLNHPALKMVDGKVADSSVQELMPTLLNIATGDLLDLVLECTTPTPPDSLPHWVLPDLATAWLEESFLRDPEKQLRPWVQAMETLLVKLTGKPMSIWEIFSKFSSPAVTPGTTSGTVSNPTSPTADGASPSSGSGASDPAAS